MIKEYETIKANNFIVQFKEKHLKVFEEYIFHCDLPKIKKGLFWDTYEPLEILYYESPNFNYDITKAKNYNIYIYLKNDKNKKVIYYEIKTKKIEFDFGEVDYNYFDSQYNTTPIINKLIIYPKTIIKKYYN